MLAAGSAIAAPAAATPAATNTKALCGLISKMYEVFKVLRVLAFLGAGFIVAKYGWDFISTGKVSGKEGVEGLKTVGIPLLIGFTLLFGINIILELLMNGNAIDCKDTFMQWK